MLRLFFATALLACTVRAADGQEPDFDDYFRFVTRPDIEAPKWDITIYDEDRLQIANEGQANYHWFVAPYDDLEQKVFPKWNGPLIYDTQGDLIWSGAPDRNYSNTYDFRVSQVDGKPMLSFLTIKGTDGQSGFILDDSYQIHAQVDTRGDLPDSNMHEFNVVDNGHSALVVANPGIDPVPITIPSRNGSAAWNGTCRIRQEGFREVDVQTGRVNFEFSPLGRVKAKEHTYMDTDIGAWKDRCSQNFDAFHVNAVDKFDNGDYLFSMRYTDTIYKVSGETGDVIWRLGGTESDFVLEDQAANFSRQHDARIQAHNSTHTIISLFNNAAGPGLHNGDRIKKSEGLLLSLHTAAQPMTARIIVAFEEPEDGNIADFIRSRGSLHFLPNGNALVGWVKHCYLSEHAPDGTILMKAIALSTEGDSYRTYKMPWIGRPLQPPDVVAAAKRDGSITEVHVSWNGATEVASWVLLRTNEVGNISALVASSPRKGFETKLTATGTVEYVIAVALDSSQNELGRSNVVHVDIPRVLHDPVATSEQDWLDTHSAVHWAPSVEQSTSAPGSHAWFGIGFACAVALTICALWVQRRMLRNPGRRKSWWASALRRQEYDAVGDQEEEEVAEHRHGMMLQMRGKEYRDEEKLDQRRSSQEETLYEVGEDDEDEAEGRLRKSDGR